MKLKRQVIFSKERKFSQGGCCRFILTNRELQSKLKNNNHLVRLVKNVIPSEQSEKGMNHEDEGKIIHLGFSYLYKNVTVNNVRVRKAMWYEAHGKYNDNLLSNLSNENSVDLYHEVSFSHHDNSRKRNKYESRGNIKEVYSYVINSINKLTPQQVLLILHSFIIHGVQVDHLIKINEHVINNIYNFKTSELILIHLFYIYFEGINKNGVAVEAPLVAGHRRDSSTYPDPGTYCDGATWVEPPFGKDENYYHQDGADSECSSSLYMSSQVDHKIRPLAKELIRYTSHLFYKRREHLLVNQIEEILFIWSKYNLYHKELFDHCVRVVEKYMHSLNVNNMEMVLKGESHPLVKIRKESVHNLNNFDLIIKCFYHLSGIREVVLLKETRFKYFSQFALFLRNNSAILTHLPLCKLFMLLKVSEHTDANCQVEKGNHLKWHLLSLIEDRLKRTNQDYHYKRKTYPEEESKNLSKYVQVLDVVGTYYLDVYNSYNDNTGVKQPPTSRVANQLYEKAQNVGKRNGEAPADASFTNVNNTSKAVAERNNCAHDVGRGKTGVLNCPPKLTFLRNINEYITVESESCKKYLPILLSILKEQKQFQHMLLYFINLFDKRSNANVLIPYIKLTCEYVNNIYVLSYMGYLYKCAITRKDFSNGSNFNSEKVVVLMSTLHTLIRRDHNVLESDKCSDNPPLNVLPSGITFHQNNERFLISLRQINPNVYEHVQANLLNLNLKEIKKLDEFLFHYVYKYMVNDTFEYLENIVPYMNNEPLVNHLLWLFVQINNYYSVHSNGGGGAPREDKIATLFFQKICILNFLKTYQDKSDNCYETVKNILTYVRLEKDAEKALSNYVLNLYFKKYTGPLGNEDMFVYITDMLQKLSNCNCILTYQNDGTFLICSNKTDQLSKALFRSQIMHIINTLVQNNSCAHLINLLFLVNTGVSFGTLFGGIRNHLYSYAF
ncbi:conserved Plasmodium protein, unknown function [Plasmodium knowlesi strain H]|uniref:Uncharacterized protein n=3 Tax=Plasmodium knowlesi TaxID=5850 RepID=A0A1A7VPB1_PLAKH|nr:conserved Plasmodium protein, unknown function [Plasmodium knowlesi strain H]OTN65604.1 Uncharacterized protein PKNOH_S110093200 [Plasmodium knowlesi]CAA9989551.1 conserved Plasmodium protein, unknown function [Plasmodium knowlesi strain H]SBO22572.1 conserved Plasmodium protein, unknown function [Plasmodium knowlesi strain H]SBO23532.1 conserved Plasmodium protein, unknown function [Plasmodium knowlesi strain H]VVS79025.1 conserved Plasmodium protein, unknown function [Plasmodium knowlesi 